MGTTRTVGLPARGLDKVRHARVHVVTVQARIVLHGLVIAVHVPAEASWWAIVAPIAARQAGEDLGVAAEREGRAPHPLGRLVLQPVVQVLVVHSTEEEAVEARLS